MSPVELQRALHTVEPAAVLVAPSVLDKIIRHTLKLPGWMWHVPHHRNWIVDRQFLFRYVEQEDLFVPPDSLLPATVLLLETPDRGGESEGEAALRLTYWRRLFHITVDLELTNQNGAGKWTSALVQARIGRLGETVFEEIRAVLLQDHHLPPGPDERSVYLEFVAVFLETYYFARPLLESYFPAIRDVEEVRKLLDEDLDGEAVFQRTRLPGAPDPGRDVANRPHEAHEFFYELVSESDQAEQTGNLVWAAIQRTRAARVAPAAQAFDTRKQAVDFLEKLLARLQPALAIPADELPQWREHLPELLDKADQGSRPAEAHLLYDLQKVCIDFEREIYTLDLVEWLLSGGKKPVQRALTSQRFVRVTRHLRSAAQRLTMARLSEIDRKHFAGLLQVALGRCEDRVRERFRPILTSAIEDVGLAPRNPHETTAFLKLTEELLDRILEYGFLNFSDLRDALARNRLKLPDLTDPQDFIGGDPLLRLDRRLATLLDGVYRRGEVYLRLLERFTALNFGTKLGRLLTKFVSIPFLSAFLILEMLNYLVLRTRKHFAEHPADLESMPADPESIPAAVAWMPLYVYVPLLMVFGVFLLGLIHSAEVRRLCADAGRSLWGPLRVLFVVVPLWLVRNPALKKIVSSWTFQLFYWYVFKPLVLCAALWLIVPETFAEPLQAALAFLAANFFVNSRPGQEAAESISHGIQRFFALLRSGLIPGLIRFFVELFKQILHAMEGVLFAVDEWLRFRGGDTRLAMTIRTIFGVFWFPISYLARFNMVVLIEPCLNPVKFPVCAIATKIMVPMYVVIEPWLKATLSPFLGEVVTVALVYWTLFWLPDVFGFFFWEMKENWSLYAANRSKTPRPAPIGSHGETMRRLLEPGFHSGTVPKLFAKLRHAESRALRTGNYSAVRAYQASLDEVAEAVRLFVAREFLELLAQDPAWKKEGLQVTAVRLATNQVHVDLHRLGRTEAPLVLHFERKAGDLFARSTACPWFDELPADQQRTLNEALAMLWQLAGATVETERLRLDADWVDSPHGELTLPLLRPSGLTTNSEEEYR